MYDLNRKQRDDSDKQQQPKTNKAKRERRIEMSLQDHRKDIDSIPQIDRMIGQ